MHQLERLLIGCLERTGEKLAPVFFLCGCGEWKNRKGGHGNCGRRKCGSEKPREMVKHETYFFGNF